MERTADELARRVVPDWKRRPGWPSRIPQHPDIITFEAGVAMKSTTESANNHCIDCKGRRVELKATAYGGSGLDH